MFMVTTYVQNSNKNINNFFQGKKEISVNNVNKGMIFKFKNI